VIRGIQRSSSGRCTSCSPTAPIHPERSRQPPTLTSPQHIYPRTIKMRFARLSRQLIGTPCITRSRAVCSSLSSTWPPLLSVRAAAVSATWACSRCWPPHDHATFLVVPHTCDGEPADPCHVNRRARRRPSGFRGGQRVQYLPVSASFDAIPARLHRRGRRSTRTAPPRRGSCCGFVAAYLPADPGRGLDLRSPWSRSGRTFLWPLCRVRIWVHPHQGDPQRRSGRPRSNRA